MPLPLTLDDAAVADDDLWQPVDADRDFGPHGRVDAQAACLPDSRFSLGYAERMPRPQTGEPCKVTVSRNQFAAMLDRERGEVGVGDERAVNVRAQVCKDVPMPTTRNDHDRARPIQEPLAETDGRFHRRWGVKDFRIRHDADQ